MIMMSKIDARTHLEVNTLGTHEFPENDSGLELLLHRKAMNLLG
jgi:hypothetical protein